MFPRLCACRRDHRDLRRPHRERARHRGGAAAAFVARRATEGHPCAVPAPPRGPWDRFLALRGSAAPPPPAFPPPRLGRGPRRRRFFPPGPRPAGGPPPAPPPPPP